MIALLHSLGRWVRNWPPRAELYIARSYSHQLNPAPHNQETVLAVSLAHNREITECCHSPLCDPSPYCYLILADLVLLLQLLHTHQPSVLDCTRTPRPNSQPPVKGNSSPATRCTRRQQTRNRTTVPGNPLMTFCPRNRSSVTCTPLQSASVGCTADRTILSYPIQHPRSSRIRPSSHCSTTAHTETDTRVIPTTPRSVLALPPPLHRAQSSSLARLPRSVLAASESNIVDVRNNHSLLE